MKKHFEKKIEIVYNENIKILTGNINLLAETNEDTLEEIELWREDIRDEKKDLRHIAKNVNTCYKMLNEKYKKT